MPLLLSETKAQCWALSCAEAFELLGHHRRIDEPVRHLRSNGVSRGCSSGDIRAQGAHHMSGGAAGQAPWYSTHTHTHTQHTQHTHTQHTHTHTRKYSSLTTLLLAVDRFPNSTASVYPWLRGTRVMARRGGCASGSISQLPSNRLPLLWARAKFPTTPDLFPPTRIYCFHPSSNTSCGTRSPIV